MNCRQVNAVSPKPVASFQIEIQEVPQGLPRVIMFNMFSVGINLPRKVGFLYVGKQVLIDNTITEDYTQFTTYVLTSGMLRKVSELCRS